MNLCKILKRKISTPVAVGIVIFYCSFLVGSFLVWQTGLGAIRIQEKKERSFSSDKYIFLDQHTHIHGEILEKKEGAICGGRMIDFPTYSFDSEEKLLKGLINFDVNETLKVVYGSGLRLSGDAGGGASSSLTGIYEIPYENNNIVIDRVDNNGTVYFTYKEKKIDLKPNETWKDEQTAIVEESGCKMKKIVTETITNYGVIDKDKIQQW